MVTKRRAIHVVIIAFMVIAGVFAQMHQAQAFPRGSVFRNITVNPGAIPSGGQATVTVSYMCEASGCFDKGGLGQLIIKPTGVFKQVSTCSGGFLGNYNIPFSYACFDGPLSNDAIVQRGNQRLPTNNILVPPPEPASPELHVLQAVLEANAAMPGTSLIICYQEEPVAAYTDPRLLNGSFTPGTDLFTLIQIAPPEGDPPSTTVSGASGVYASLCVFVLVTSGAPQQIRLLDTTSTNFPVGARVIVRALVTDQNGNPVPGVNVSFTSSDASQASLTCSTVLDFNAAGYSFNPIYTGSFPGPSGVPSAGTVPNPGVGIQAGQTSLGSPFPLTTGTAATVQSTPLGYTCYSGTPSGGATGLGLVPPGTVTVLTDNTGVAYVTLLALAAATPGAGVVVTATVHGGGVPSTGLSARSAPFSIIGAALSDVIGQITFKPAQIVSPANSAQIVACFASPVGLPVPQGAAIVFTIVEKTVGVVDTAFAQAESGDQNQQVTRAAGPDGCATATAIATGGGTMTVSAAIGPSVVTGTIAVGAGGVQAGQTGMFATNPSATTSTCPGPLQWIGLYWRGANTAILQAIAACPNVDRAWVRRGTTWLAAAPDQPAMSDHFDALNGEFVFLHGRP